MMSKYILINFFSNYKDITNYFRKFENINTKRKELPLIPPLKYSTK